VNNPGDCYQLPSGASSVAVYTDEHGEAQVEYLPGTGFYFNSLLASHAAIGPNSDGGCDLQTVGLLGTSVISAVARYPYKPVNYAAMKSGVVHKDVRSLWSKTLSYYPKGTGAANANSRIVVAHAQDINGAPFAGEVVCFSSDAESTTWFNGTVNGINLGGTSLAKDPKGGHRLCVRTDSNGNAAVAVLESKSVHVNVIGDFTNEWILRSVDVDFTTPNTVVNNQPLPTQTVTPPPSGNGNTAPPPSMQKALGVPPSTNTTHPNKQLFAARLHLARLVRPQHGRHYVTISVTGSKGTAHVKLRMTVLTRVRVHGHVWTRKSIRTLVVSVTIGHTVNITVPSSVVSVSVSLR